MLENVFSGWKLWAVATCSLATVIVGCKKSDSSGSGGSGNGETLGGTKVNFTAYQTASGSNDSTLHFIGSSVASPSSTNKGDYINISAQLPSGKKWAVGKYQFSKNLSTTIISINVGGKDYNTRWSDTTSTITITALDNTSVSGSYNARVYASETSGTVDSVGQLLNGNFSGKF